jgi:prepilin-type N-terminal cleavage/methylation domain-containing protein
MNESRRLPRTDGLTLIELLVVLAVLAIAVAMLMPSVSNHPVRAPRINCVNNLKQVGLAFRSWAFDHGDQFPMGVSTNAGGTMELVSGPNAFAHFQVVSNELSTPRVLFCPADSKRTSATNFADFSNLSLSYFVGVDAVATNEQRFLSGDRNITNGATLENGILVLTTNQPAGWTHQLHAKSGNIGLADGSVQQLTPSRLREAIASTGVATNRLAMP